MRVHALLAAAAIVAVAAPAHAAITVSADLYSPGAIGGSILTPITLAGVPVPTNTAFNGAGFAVSFSGVPADQGVVQGYLPSRHAVPVAGKDGSNNPLYLSGDYGSALTGDIAASGKYLSTDRGSITITFATPQDSLALLWGSVDNTNEVSISVGGLGTVTGTQIATLTGAILNSGNQGLNGSAYVVIDSDTKFTTVTLSSGSVSFEATGLVGSDRGFNVPEPVSLGLLGAGLVGLGLTRRKR